MKNDENDTRQQSGSEMKPIRRATFWYGSKNPYKDDNILILDSFYEFLHLSTVVICRFHINGYLLSWIQDIMTQNIGEFRVNVCTNTVEFKNETVFNPVDNVFTPQYNHCLCETKRPEKERNKT
jgi:hypothetical protein